MNIHALFEFQDAKGSLKTVEQKFSVDGSVPDFAFWPRFILMMNIYTLVSNSNYLDSFFLTSWDG
jgi:hypothetical protein